MAEITKAAGTSTTIRTLTQPTAWVGGVVPTSADVARWVSTSSSGNHTGSLTLQGLKIEGATADIVHTSGTLTLTTANAFVNTLSNNRRWTQNGGIIALGGNNTTFTLYHSAYGWSVNIASTGGLTGSGTLTVANASSSAGDGWGTAVFGIQGNTAGFTGTFRLTDRTALACGTSSTAVGFTAANVVVDGPGCAIINGVANAFLGTSARTLTINYDVDLGFYSSNPLYIQSAVLLGATSKKLTVESQTTLSGAISGTGGFTKSGSADLVLSGTSTLTGTVTASAGSLVVGAYNSGTPNQLNSVTDVVINSAVYFWGSSAYTFSVPFSATTFNPSIASSIIGTNNSSTVTLGHDASVAAFIGCFNPTCDDTVSGRLLVNVLPTNAALTVLAGYTTSATARSATIAFNHATGGTVPLAWQIYVHNASTGGVHAIEDNGASATVFSGNVTHHPSSNTSGTGTLRLTGTNTDSTLSGSITPSRGSIALSKTGTGTWTLSGNNTFTGGISVDAGTLKLRHGNALGTTGSVSQTAGATIDIAGGITLNKSSAPFTLDSGASTTALNVPDSGGDNTIQCTSVTLNSQLIVNVGADAAMRFRNTQAIQQQGAEVNGFTKNGRGELDLGSFANTYTGPVTSNAGTLTVGASCAPSTNGPLGNASSTVSIVGGESPYDTDAGYFKYNGSSTSSATISRAIQLSGPSAGRGVGLIASGNGPVLFNNVAITANVYTLFLRGTNESANELASSFSVPGFQKRDTGKWRLTGAVAAGYFSVYQGTLDFGGSPRSLQSNTGGVTSITLHEGTVTNGAANVSCYSVIFSSTTPGTIRAPLSGTTAVDFNPSAKGILYPESANGSNSHTGSTTVGSGKTLTLYTDANPRTAGNGKVTGDGNVSVTGNLAVRAATQNGCARYGGNLTFNAGSKLRIGVAA